MMIRVPLLLIAEPSQETEGNPYNGGYWCYVPRLPPCAHAESLDLAVHNFVSEYDDWLASIKDFNALPSPKDLARGFSAQLHPCGASMIIHVPYPTSTVLPTRVRSLISRLRRLRSVVS